MNTKYSIKKVWYYLLCMIMTLQLIACTEETHESYTAAPEVEDIYIDQLEELINKMKDLQKNSEYGEKKGQYPTESRATGTYCLHHHLSWMKLCAERGFRHFSPSCVPLSLIIGKCLSAVNRHFAQKQMFLCGGHYQTPPRPVMSHGAGSASKLCLAFILETVI